MAHSNQTCFTAFEVITTADSALQGRLPNSDVFVLTETRDSLTVSRGWLSFMQVLSTAFSLPPAIEANGIVTMKASCCSMMFIKACLVDASCL